MSLSDRKRPDSSGSARLKLASTSTGRVIRCTKTGSNITAIPIISNAAPAWGALVTMVTIGIAMRRIDPTRSNIPATLARRVLSFNGPNPDMIMNSMSDFMGGNNDSR